MANLREVAAEAGVSLASAARVLSEDPTFKVSDQTKQHIYEAARQLNYVYKKKSTKKKNTWKVGFILALTSEKYSDPYFTSILSAAEEEAKKLGIEAMVARNYNEIKDEKGLRQLFDLELDAIILMERLSYDLYKQIKEHIPYVIGIEPNITSLNTISFNAIDATMLVMNHFFSIGCKRIAYIGGVGQNEPFDSSLRMMAYREALRKQGIPYDETIIKNCNWDLSLCGQYTEALLSSENPPDAIFAGSDTLAAVVLGKIFSMGLYCPKDISVIGFNNLPMSEHTIPPLTTIEVPTKEIGKIAIRRLYELLSGKDDLILDISLPVKLILRESTEVKKK